MQMISAVRHEVARVERGASLQASVQRLSPLPLCVTGNGGVESEGERLRKLRAERGNQARGTPDG
jgi:hypothetical protein